MATNTGISMITPVSYLLDILDRPDVRKERWLAERAPVESA